MAIGITVFTEGVDAQAAELLLRATARERGVSVHALAKQIVDPYR